MQDIHLIGGGGARFFGGGDRRLRLNHQQNLSVKCPRCDSLNTKFCYYNNYNLSQPRHFCKSCRRYWTKGGVLRNVPVGGGCRKTKRSKGKQSPESQLDRKSNSNSSSESSSLTVTTLATATTAAGETAIDAGPATCLSSITAPFRVPGSRFFVPQSTCPNFEHSASESGLLPEIGSFNASDILPYRSNQQQNHEQQWQLPKMNDELSAGFLDQTTVQFDLQRSSNGGGFTLLDWQIGGDQGIYEFSGTDQAYWNQNQWSSDHDQPLYLP